MDTNDLIKALAADATSTRPTPILKVWTLAILAAVCVAALVFFGTLGPRPDISQAAQTPRFLFKFVATGVLVAVAFIALRIISRPDGDGRRARILFAAPLGVLAIAVMAELAAIPASDWKGRLVGTNSILCLTFIPLIGLAPLALFLAGLRHGAPSSPRLAGAVAGSLAGGIAATFYAAHCIDDSPLFIAVWYTMAIALLSLAGAIISAKTSRW